MSTSYKVVLFDVHSVTSHHGPKDTEFILNDEAKTGWKLKYMIQVKANFFWAIFEKNNENL